MRPTSSSDPDSVPLMWIPTDAAQKTVGPRKRLWIEAQTRACSRVSTLPGGRIPVVLVDLGAQLRVQTDVRIQLRAPVYPFLAKLRLHEAPAHVTHGLDRYQEVTLVEAQEPPLRGVNEAHLPVDLVDE